MAEAPKEGEMFDSFIEFETFLHQYCSTTAQTFVVDNSRKIETHVNERPVLKVTKVNLDTQS